jgi:aspartate aminotransferase
MAKRRAKPAPAGAVRETASRGVGVSGAVSGSPGVQLNLRVRGLKNSPTIAINERSDELHRQGRRVFKLGLGQSPFPVPPPVVQALRDHADCKDYLPVRGLPALREAVAGYHRRTHGTRCTSDDVLVGPGSKELMFLLQIVYYGDLIVPTPAWVSYAASSHRRAQLPKQSCGHDLLNG